MPPMALPHQHLDWIDSQASWMVDTLRDWAHINSASDNLPGLAQMLNALEPAFAELGPTPRRIDLPPRRIIDRTGEVVDRPLGQALQLQHRPNASLRVLLNIHMDTVHDADGPFQRTDLLDENTLRGPGVADAKGGLVIMLTALLALKRSGLDRQIGWEVLINPDEEIGSPGSTALLRERARQHHLGLVFEPTLPDGAMVSQRGGSGNFTLVVRGRRAHAGRDFHHGRNAILVLAEAVTQLNALNGRYEGLTLNVGHIEGGGPLNIVPDLAIARFNVRYQRPEQETTIRQHYDRILQAINRREDYHAELHGGFYAPPKSVTPQSQRLIDAIDACGRDLGLEIHWKRTGGVSDGNRLAAAGLPNVDTLGPRGDGLHSHSEHVLLDSLPERARLTALLLMKLANGELAWPPPVASR